ncbi:MAG: Stp1/IreP family PP2C-type Ser/Thr phosphatase [Muribaculaceae bacterium]|nr:Stp1/IreP family PP2C-type Ser/Thr phosphatase [Muribaculaceae bacterium]
MGLTIIDNNNIFQKDVIGNVRTAQEDSHDIAALTPNGDVFVVCDGMGGHVGGKQASFIAVKSIIEYLKKERYSEPVLALNNALQFANMQILGYASEHPELRGMGTTACIVLLQESEAYIAHVGDSRIYLYLGKEKQLHRITKDHSFVQTLVDAGQITDEEAEHHPNKNRILKALGIKPDLVPSFDKVQPKNGDIFLICSDGLSGMISDSIIRDVMMQNRSIEGKGETLINLALECGGVDNITVELVQIVNSPHTKSIFRSYNPTSNNISRRKFKKFKQTMIAICAIVVCITVGYGIYWSHQSAKYKKDIRDLNDEIQEDSIALIQAKKEFERDSIAWRQSESTTKVVRTQWEKDKTEYNKKAYDLAVKATEALKSNFESKRETLNHAIDSLCEKQQIRERLINQKKKQ